MKASLAFTLLKWSLGIFTLFTSFYLKTPFLQFIREVELFLLAFFLLVLLFLGVTQFIKSKGNRYGALESAIFLVLYIAIIGLSAYKESQFYIAKANVLTTETERLQKLGNHFVVGFRDYEEVKHLVSMGAVGGVYYSQRNVKGKDEQTVRNEIEELKRIRLSLGLSPLIVATDQEGGIVSRVSPPLSKLPPLSILLDNYHDSYDLQKKVTVHAAFQANKLADLGVNVNFSPVVDLKIWQAFENLNFHSSIYKRAISKDEKIVTLVAKAYCQALEKKGVIPTLKHFPGLGRIHKDTHFFPGDLTASIEDLEEKDWMPFKEVSSQTGAFIMLGHVKLNQIDKENLVSFSHDIIQKIIRHKWGHNGVLITDDMNMRPVFHSHWGIGGAAVKVLNAGVDLLLISYDGDQFYPAMAALIDADVNGKLDDGLLYFSGLRLKKSLENHSFVLK